ncbi:MAG: hypothetical protein U0271_07275 [Polyangiaceae bacterium]
MRKALVRGVCASLALASALCAARPARAADVEITGTTATQFYEVGSPWGYELQRQRILQTLGFSLYHLQGDYRPGKDDYSMRILFRIDADVGIGQHLSSDLADAETDYAVAGGTRFVPGLSNVRLDLVAAYLEGRNLAGGWLTFRAGRQTMTDVLGWWSFDGGLVRVHTPAFFDVEVYGGFEQRGGIPLSTSRYESQGVWRGSHGGFDEANGTLRSTDYPSYQFASYAPAFGVALESAGPSWVHGRLSYRRVYNTGEAFTSPFPDGQGGFQTVDGLRVSSERLGWAANIEKPDLGGLKGGFTYDFYNQVFPTIFGGIEANILNRVTIGLDADHFTPTFDADSIFNWFTHNPTTTATARVEAHITKELDISAQGGVRLWSTEGDPDTLGAAQCVAAGLPENCKEQGSLVTPQTPPGGTSVAQDEANRDLKYVLDGLGLLAIRYHHTLGWLDFRGMAQVGERGRRVGGEIVGQKTFDGGRYDVNGRLSVYDFFLANDTDEGDSSSLTSFSYSLGVGVKPLDLAHVGLEWEHSVNDNVGQRFRVLGRLDVKWGR